MAKMTGLPLLLLLFWVLPPSTAKTMQTICVLKNPFELKKKWDYYKPGEPVIGGNLPLAALISSNVPDFQLCPFELPFMML